MTKDLGNILNSSIVGEWLIKEKRAKWHSAMPPSILRVMYGSYYRADKDYKEMELFTNKIDMAIESSIDIINYWYCSNKTRPLTLAVIMFRFFFVAVGGNGRLGR